ncbi:hypothetical protein B0H11DRAFT_2286564 [Mycena galericulata]|nr:hypothetical protein B0H11DRAFT_2286564 [Mycena galericulata]
MSTPTSTPTLPPTAPTSIPTPPTSTGAHSHPRLRHRRAHPQHPRAKKLAPHKRLTPTMPPQGLCCACLKMVKITDSLDASTQFSVIAFASRALRPCPLDRAPSRERDGPRGPPRLRGRAGVTFEVLYFLAHVEPHLPVLPSLTALTHLSLHAPSPASIPALLHAATPSLTAPTLHFPPAALPALVGLCVASDATPDSPLHAENQDGASKGTIPALLAPNLRALAVPAASAASTAAGGAGARVDVGKGKQKGGQRGRRRRSGASAGASGGTGAQERYVLLPPLFISLLFASLRLHDAPFLAVCARRWWNRIRSRPLFTPRRCAPPHRGFPWSTHRARWRTTRASIFYVGRKRLCDAVIGAI